MKNDKRTALQAALNAHAGRTQWALGDNVETKAIGQLHPSAAAMTFVREALSEYDIPEMKLRYAGMKRGGAEGGATHKIQEGVITIQAELKSLSGVRQYVDIPVLVHQGHMVYPEVLLHNGQPRVLAQTTFDDLIAVGDIYRGETDRKHMYAVPPEAGALTTKPRPATQGAWTEVRKHAAVQDRTHLDPAERDRSAYLMPGQKTKTAHEVAITDRGGIVTKVPAGTAVTIVRDMFGDDSCYYAEIEGYCAAPLNRKDLAKK